MPYSLYSFLLFVKILISLSIERIADTKEVLYNYEIQRDIFTSTMEVMFLPRLIGLFVTGYVC